MTCALRVIQSSNFVQITKMDVCYSRINRMELKVMMKHCRKKKFLSEYRDNIHILLNTLSTSYCDSNSSRDVLNFMFYITLNLIRHDIWLIKKIIFIINLSRP